MRYVCEVPGMILLQAYLRGVTYEVLPMSIHALSPMMLPPLETFLELMLWNSFQCCHIFLDVFIILNLLPFKAGFIFGNSQKSFRAKSGE
jgi:hypothetical protein